MPYRPHLVSSTTRPTVRPLVQKVFGDFDPLRLDPYLLFDARTSMVGTLENPTLDLDPATPSTLDVITATRAGTATFTDADGNIASAPANTVRVDYTQGAELTPTVFQRVGYTDFSSGWGNLNSTSSAGNGYLGQPSLIVNAPVVNARTTTSAPTETGVSYTASFYVRYVSGSSGLVWMYTQFASDNQFTPITVTSEWTRVQVQFTGGSGSAVNFGVSPKIAGESVEIAMPQVEEGTTASDFVANTTGSPKFTGISATFAPRVPMILVEPSATNTIRWSEDSAGYNYGSGITFETSDVLAPNGQASAFKMTPDGSSVLHRQGSSYSGSYNANDVVTTSVWLKTDGYDYFLKVGGFFGAESAMFDSVDGSVQSTEANVISASSEDYGNGWYRYVVTYTFQNIITNGLLYSGVRLVERDASNNPVESFDGTGDTTGVLVYGTQFELGSVATSYIPTDNDISGVTRAADDLVISGSDFTDFYNQSEGTLYVEYEPRFTNVTNSALFFFSDGGSANRIISLVHQSYNLFISTSDVVVAQFGGGTPQANTLNRVAATFKANDARLSLNGANEVTDTSLTMPPVNQLHIGQRTNLVHQLNGHIKRLIYWPYHSDSL